ncbi:hypothetical protein SAMN05518855_1006221 [Paenibacillus sp. CF384]|nr:hypothetical protein SAMN05518855_1006221 [Paenibacillus sp. CF384]
MQMEQHARRVSMLLALVLFVLLVVLLFIAFL